MPIKFQQPNFHDDEVDGYIDRDGDFVTGCGQVLGRVHSLSACKGEPCVIHNPSDHSMRGFPTYWRGDRSLMERICPHGVGHPDPDHLAGVRRLAGADVADGEGIHGCDGCCGGT